MNKEINSQITSIVKRHKDRLIFQNDTLSQDTFALSAKPRFHTEMVSAVGSRLPASDESSNFLQNGRSPLSIAYSMIQGCHDFGVSKSMITLQRNKKRHSNIQSSGHPSSSSALER